MQASPGSGAGAWIIGCLCQSINILCMSMLPVCRFVPSCSMYAELALQRHGILLGSMVALRRVLRCHPFRTPGYDPVE